ncbi:MAG: hypothetical protein EXX96DRAFT_610965 [Benjaminiella poitrasii]|nr:MAG: hypothetical protein EXX96DRAFT_610965 [Benjaminiella poitrasii]
MTITIDDKFKALPLDIQKRIFNFANFNYNIYLGLELSPLEIFQNKGIYVILQNILFEEADLKSLLYLKRKYLKKEDEGFIIYFAAETGNLDTVRKVCLLWKGIEKREEGFLASVKSNFFWGTKHLGPLPLDSEKRITWSDVTENMDYKALIPLSRRGEDMLFLNVDQLLKGEVEENSLWILNFPEEYYPYVHEEFKAVIQFCKGDKQSLLDWYRTCVVEEYEFSDDDNGMGSKLLALLINRFLKDDPEFVRAAITIYNNASCNKSIDVAANNVPWFIYHVLKINKELLPFVSQLDSPHPYFEFAKELIEAVETKNIELLRDRFPYPGSEDEDHIYFELYFIIMWAYDYLHREEYLDESESRFYYESDSRRSHGAVRTAQVPVCEEPNRLLERISQGILYNDSDKELYTRSKYALEKLGHNYNSLIDRDVYASMFSDSYLEDDLDSCKSPMHIQALYEHYRFDPSFQLSNLKDAVQVDEYYYSNNYTDDCILWLFYKVFVERIPLMHNSEFSQIGFSDHFNQTVLELEPCPDQKEITRLHERNIKKSRNHVRYSMLCALSNLIESIG